MLATIIMAVLAAADLAYLLLLIRAWRRTNRYGGINPVVSSILEGPKHGTTGLIPSPKPKRRR